MSNKEEEKASENFFDEGPSDVASIASSTTKQKKEKSSKIKKEAEEASDKKKLKVDEDGNTCQIDFKSMVVNERKE